MRCSVIFSLFIAAATQQQAEDVNQVSKQFFAASYEMTEIDWRLKRKPYLCISECVSPKLQPAQPPAFVDRVFAPTRRIIDCSSGVRQVSSTCLKAGSINFIECALISTSHITLTVNTLTLQQLGQLPLLYFSSFNMMSRFGAEKFCSLHGMNFGLPQDEMLRLLDLLPDGRFWMQILTFSYSKLLGNSTTCSYVTKKKNTSALSCEENLNFVCSLPAMCHQDSCQQKCASNNEDLFCRASNPELATPKCFPTCPLVDCTEQPQENMGFELGEGSMINSCDRMHFISKRTFVTVASASMYCCEKQMKLTSLETQAEIKCLANELKKRKEKDAKFWTSASSAGCLDFGWCSSNELLDYVGLGISRNSMDFYSKQCLAAFFSEGTSQLSLSETVCSGNKYRAICEMPKHFMCRRSECWKFKCPKERDYLNNLKTAKLFNSGVTVIRGCGREFNLKTLGADNFYRGSKLACGHDFNMISLDTPRKLQCVQELFLAKNIPSGRYWVGGTSYGCHWDTRWCNLDGEPPISDNEDIVWRTGEPSNNTKKDCLALEFDSEKKPHMMFFKEECEKKLSTIMESKILYI